MDRMLSRRTLLAGTAALAAGTLSACTSAGSGAGTTPSTGSATPTPSTTAAVSTTAPSTATPRATSSPSPAGKPSPKVAETIADDLNVPWSIVFLASGDALVSERDTARILRITAKGKISTLGEVSGVQAPSGLGEGGLLGLALDPDDQETLYAYCTTSSDNRVVRLSLAGGTVGRPRAVLTGIPTSTHHHGGRLLFAPDGNLFVSTGDAEVPARAQNKKSLAGKILRIRRDGSAASGNPFGNRTWTYGHRNIEGLAFDADGRLWATEFGDKKADELNLILKGRNYGWPNVEGRSNDDRYQNPEVVWSPTSTCSPAGLAITRSTAFVGALRGRSLFAVPLDGPHAGTPKEHFAGDYGRIRSVAAAPDGSLWVTTSNTDGRATPGRHDDKILRVTL
ncbi:PQQ-dependent sugar dehydrogenase [Microlunatus ginsengisoli]|uniref:PQQ-dependent sugar dehydrogenase n=2 Tax=Microlunatus ginsengisoli TaxID=363863 RepID=A0ABP6ZJD7_9ACTN